MRHSPSIVVLALCAGLAGACQPRRDVPAVGDASTTAATEPLLPRVERALEPAEDAGVEQPVAPDTRRAAPEQPPPPDEQQRARERRLERATLTIVQARDRDRNLGIVAATPARIEVDAGACEVGIEIKHAP